MYCGRRGFSVTAPSLRDDLSDSLGPIDSLEIIRCHLKAHLFQTAFADNKILSGN